jgi:vancomycin resistance protein YoaR
MGVMMKRGVIVLVSGVAVVSVVLAAVSQGVEAKLQKGSTVGVVEVGSLTVAEARMKVRLWWEKEKFEQLTLILKDKSLKKTYTPTSLGVMLDDMASVAQVPVDGVVGQIIGSEQKQRFALKFTKLTVDLAELRGTVKESYGDPGPAKVKFQSGKIVRMPEKPRLGLDESALFDAVVKGLQDDKTVALPVKEEPKKITDEMLAQVTDIISQFSTNFSSGNRPRSSNIRLASSKIDGVFLLPGEQFSFNQTVGQRTIKGGFKEAGVFINGRHDTGVGGGICQVSTTLYNASLFGNIKIAKRTNHTLPVPYVPVGRDATVNWGAQDLVIVNNYPTPIVLTSEYTPGRLTFRILGKKEPGLEVKITSGRVKTWSTGSARQYDSSLAPGQTVTKGGSMGRSLSTFRNVYKNGVKVNTEPLGVSYYAGAPSLTLYGPSSPRRAPRKSTSTKTSPSAEPAVTPPPVEESL